MALIYTFFLQHPFVTQLLTRNLVIELLDMANNPELHSQHSMDDNELEVSARKRVRTDTTAGQTQIHRLINRGYSLFTIF